MQAFIWWQSTGTEAKSGKEDTLYGLNLLRINTSGKIQQVRFAELTAVEDCGLYLSQHESKVCQKLALTHVVYR